MSLFHCSSSSSPLFSSTPLLISGATEGEASVRVTRGGGGLPLHVLRRPDFSSQGCGTHENTEFWTAGHRSAVPSFPITLPARTCVANFTLNIDGAFLPVLSARTVKEKETFRESRKMSQILISTLVTYLSCFFKYLVTNGENEHLCLIFACVFLMLSHNLCVHVCQYFNHLLM